MQLVSSLEGMADWLRNRRYLQSELKRSKSVRENEAS